MSLKELITDNARLILLVGVGYWAGVELGAIDPVALPGWWPIVAAVAIGSGLVAYFVADKLAALLPDPMGTLLVSFDADDPQGGAIWELNDEAWADLEVKKGELYAWSGSDHDVFECRDFDPDRLVAVANWRGTKTGSELATPVERGEIMDQISDMRNQYEQEARYGEAIRQTIPSLLRTLDKWRAKDLNAALEGHISPSLGDRNIDEMITDRLPPECLPDYMTDDDAPEPSDDDLGVALEVLDDGDALDPIGGPVGPEGQQPLRNDGGTDR